MEWWSGWRVKGGVAKWRVVGWLEGRRGGGLEPSKQGTPESTSNTKSPFGSREQLKTTNVALAISKYTKGATENSTESTSVHIRVSRRPKTQPHQETDGWQSRQS